MILQDDEKKKRKRKKGKRKERQEKGREGTTRVVNTDQAFLINEARSDRDNKVEKRENEGEGTRGERRREMREEERGEELPLAERGFSSCMIWRGTRSSISKTSA